MAIEDLEKINKERVKARKESMEQRKTEKSQQIDKQRQSDFDAGTQN